MKNKRDVEEKEKNEKYYDKVRGVTTPPSLVPCAGAPREGVPGPCVGAPRGGVPGPCVGAPRVGVPGPCVGAPRGEGTPGLCMMCGYTCVGVLRVHPLSSSVCGCTRGACRSHKPSRGLLHTGCTTECDPGQSSQYVQCPVWNRPRFYSLHPDTNVPQHW